MSKSVNVDFYFDPSCPFCWITSRWLITVQNNRPEVAVRWRPFSLAIKNDELDNHGNPEERAPHWSAHRVLRVIMAASRESDDISALMGDLYTAFGTQRHIMKEKYSDEVIKQVLAEQKLPAKLLASADDSSLDAELAASLQTAIDVVGDDVGVPTIVFDDGKTRSGYFGPVLSRMPSVSHSLELWDSLVVLGTSPEFFELKRARKHGDVNTASTAVCIP